MTAAGVTGGEGGIALCANKFPRFDQPAVAVLFYIVFGYT